MLTMNFRLATQPHFRWSTRGNWCTFETWDLLRPLGGIFYFPTNNGIRNRKMWPSCYMHFSFCQWRSIDGSEWQESNGWSPSTNGLKHTPRFWKAPSVPLSRNACLQGMRNDVIDSGWRLSLTARCPLRKLGRWHA